MCFPREKLQTLCPCKFYPECNKSTLLGIFFFLSYSHKGQGRFHIDSSVPQVWGWSSLEILFPVSGFETSCSPFSWSGCNSRSGSLASLFLFVLTSCYSTLWAIQQKSLKCYVIEEKHLWDVGVEVRLKAFICWMEEFLFKHNMMSVLVQAFSLNLLYVTQL